MLWWMKQTGSSSDKLWGDRKDLETGVLALGAGWGWEKVVDKG